MIGCWHEKSEHNPGINLMYGGYNNNIVVIMK